MDAVTYCDGLCEASETLAFTSRRAGAVIQLAQHIDGRWMWATNVTCGNEYRGYHVGPKWRNFAAHRDAAVTAAVDEIEEAIRRNEDAKAVAMIRDWLTRGPAAPQLELFA